MKYNRSRDAIIAALELASIGKHKQATKLIALASKKEGFKDVVSELSLIATKEFKEVSAYLLTASGDALESLMNDFDDEDSLVEDTEASSEDSENEEAEDPVVEETTEEEASEDSEEGDTNSVTEEEPTEKELEKVAIDEALEQEAEAEEELLDLNEDAEEEIDSAIARLQKINANRRVLASLRKAK